MARQIQMIFNGFIDLKLEKNDLEKQIKDALISHQTYESLKMSCDEANQQMKVLKDSIDDEYSSEKDKIDILKLDIENEEMLMSDAALNQLVKGKSISVKDKNDNEYEPIFKVKFKKI